MDGCLRRIVEAGPIASDVVVVRTDDDVLVSKRRVGAGDDRSHVRRGRVAYAKQLEVGRAALAAAGAIGPTERRRQLEVRQPAGDEVRGCVAPWCAGSPTSEPNTGEVRDVGAHSRLLWWATRRCRV